MTLSFMQTTTLNSMNMLSLAASNLSTSLLTNTAPKTNTTPVTTTKDSVVTTEFDAAADTGQELTALTRPAIAPAQKIIAAEEITPPEITEEEPIVKTARMSPAAALMMMTALATIAAIALPGEAFAQEKVADAGASIAFNTDQFIQDTKDLWWIPAVYSILLLRIFMRGVRSLGTAIGYAFRPRNKSHQRRILEEPKDKINDQRIPKKPLGWKPLPQPIESLNSLFGWFEKKLGPARDFGLQYYGLLCSIYLACKDLFTTAQVPLVSYAAPILAGALALYSRRDRVVKIEVPLAKQVENHGAPLTAQAFEQHYTRMSGPLALPVVKQFHAHETYELGKEYYKGKHKKSLWRGFWGVMDTSRFAAMLANQSIEKKGYVRFQIALWRLKLLRELAQPIEDLLDRGSVIARQCEIQLLHRMRTNLTTDYSKLDELEDDAIIFLTGNHPSIWINFVPYFFIEKDGKLLRVRPLADVKNFALHPALRWPPVIIKLPTGLMYLGLPYAGRESRRRPFDTEGDVLRKREMGIIPQWFSGGSRDELTYDEDGHLDEPGVYGHSVTFAVPEAYLRWGLAEMVTKLAKRAQKSVFIPFVYVGNCWKIAPKTTRVPPFIQAHELNNTMTAEITEILEIKPGMSKDEAHELIEGLFIRGMRTNEIVRDRFTEWAHRYRPKDAERLIATFKERADENEIYYIMADRIRCIPPTDSHRHLFQESLFDFLERPHDHDQMIYTLKGIMRLVNAHKYKLAKPIRPKRST